MPSKNNVFLLIWRRCWKNLKQTKHSSNKQTNRKASKQIPCKQANKQTNKQRKIKQKHKTKQTRTKQKHCNLWKHYKLCSNGFEMTTIILIAVSMISNVTISYQYYSISKDTLRSVHSVTWPWPISTSRYHTNLKLDIPDRQCKSFFIRIDFEPRKLRPFWTNLKVNQLQCAPVVKLRFLLLQKVTWTIV